MKIDTLLERISGLFAQAKIPFPMLPPLLIQCGAMARPGLSAIREMQEFTKKLANAGIPIGPNLDGSPNLTLAAFWADKTTHIDETVMNGQVQVAVPTPAGIVTLFGVNM